MRILVTGASGLLGLNLALYATQELAGQHVVFGTVHSHNLKTPDFSVIQADLLVPGTVERILDETQPDWVINCAALAIVDACEVDPVLARKVNIDLPQKLAILVARGGARLLHISTDAVFDGLRGNYSEEDQPNPLSVYARTKLESECVVTENNPDALIARINMFGWGLTGKRSLSEFFYYNLLAGNRVMGFTDVYFNPLLANDLVRLLLVMMDKHLNGLYHVVSCESVTKYDFGIALAQRFDLDPALITPTPVTQSDLKAARSPKLTLSCDKFTFILGKEPPSWREGLDRFYELKQLGYPQMLRRLWF